MKEFKRTPCPKCGEPPRYVIGTFLVRVDIDTGEKVAVGHEVGDGHVFECGGGHQWETDPAEERKSLKVPEDYVDYVECNCDQALMLMAIIKAMVGYRQESDYPIFKPEKDLYLMAEKLVEKFEKDHPRTNLSAWLKRLEEK